MFPKSRSQGLHEEDFAKMQRGPVSVKNHLLGTPLYRLIYRLI